MNKAQHELVLEYLQAHKEGMTSLQALEMFGVLQMPKRIFDLKKMGYDIKATPQRGKNRFGKAVNFVRYSLV